MTNTQPRSARLMSIDILRGLVMLIMTLDHVREDFLYRVPMADPMDVQLVGAGVFFTRWLAHFCAPVFVLLTGISACLHANRHQLTVSQLSGFLLRRGLLLMFLEVALINFAWTMQFPPHRIYLQVIWAIGFSMFCLSGLIWLPRRALWILAAVIIAGHNLLDGIAFAEDTLEHWLWALLHKRSLLPLGEYGVRTSYPVLPWVGVIVLGYLSGRLFTQDYAPSQRRRMLMDMGKAALLCFVALRIMNNYGDPAQWQWFDGKWLLTAMSFLNLTKYPPSLLFLLMTLAPACFLLCIAEKWQGKLVPFVQTFGRVPFFYYVLHLYVIDILYWLCCHLAGQEKIDVGHIGWVWAISFGLLVSMYPLVAYFARLKARKASPLLSYF
jgi:uncharacterized membrane protein